jgi:hypothetical protein
MEKNSTINPKFKILGYSMTNYKHGPSSTMFNIEVQESNDCNPWHIKRSFTDFQKLHKDLKSIIGSMNKATSLPKMVKSSMMAVTKTKSLDKRMEKLNAYLNELTN